ncbi:MAG TPA: PIG-L deacetylase family protein, partial [Actinomycetota bacterium]|nr:PIG-L deacetylase family protein [Actinomycetota bacterium]
PDDMEFGAAGTLAVWADAGAEVTLCIVTDGSTGTQDRELMGERLAAVRKQESRRAADVVGIRDLVWLDRRDGYVEYTLDLRRDIARVFRKYRPHRFLVMDPAPTIEDRFVNHPDHRAVGQASLDVTLTAGTTPGHFPELLDEGLQPWRGLRELWIGGPGAKPVAVDITASIDRKIEALLCHQSQVGSNASQIAEFVRKFSAEAGRAAGYGSAETFQVISQGPGFHDEDTEEADLDLARPPVDPRSAPTK